MPDAVVKPKYIVEGSGKRSAVVLSISNYRRLLAAWEEVADAADFAQARRSAKKFVSPDELRRRVMRKR